MTKNRIVIPDKSIRLTRSTAMDNDLTFFTAVMSEINDVISQTYGPEAGYVAQTSPDRGTYTYTKDGLTTLTNMRFNDAADHQVLNMVQDLAYRIKETSGDGSTTATKLLYYMIKGALERSLSLEKNELIKLRVNTPKVINYLSSFIKSEISEWKETSPTTGELRDAALISLNNDESLMEPIDQLMKHLKETNAPIDDTLIIETFKGYKDETEIDYNPGYVLGVNRFSIDSTLTGITDAKVIMIPNYWSIDYIHFIISALVEAAQSFSQNVFIVFMISSMDDQTRAWLKKLFKKAHSNNETVRFDIIEMNATSNFDSERLEDITYLLNTDLISLQTYVEKRDDIVDGSVIDHPDTTELVKWKKRLDPETGIMDYEWGKREFLNEYYNNFSKSFYCNIETRPRLGLTLSLSQTALDKQRTPEYKEVFNRHLEGLKLASKGKDVEKAREAKERLKYLKDNFYVLNVAKRLGDDERLYTQYKDATRAITSIASHGYYMGGSVGAYITVSSLSKKSELIDKIPESLRDTYTFLLKLLKEAIGNVILDLKYDFKLIHEESGYKELGDPESTIVNHLIKNKRIDPREYTIDDTRVIIPIETDLVTIPETLYIFSNLFSSLKIEFNNPVDALRFTQLSNEVRKVIDNKEEKESFSEDKKPVTKPEKEVIVKEEVKEEIDEEPLVEYKETEEEEITPDDNTIYETERGETENDSNYKNEIEDSYDEDEEYYGIYEDEDVDGGFIGDYDRDDYDYEYEYGYDFGANEYNDNGDDREGEYPEYESGYSDEQIDEEESGNEIEEEFEEIKSENRSIDVNKETKKEEVVQPAKSSGNRFEIAYSNESKEPNKSLVDEITGLPTYNRPGLPDPKVFFEASPRLVGSNDTIVLPDVADVDDYDYSGMTENQKRMMMEINAQEMRQQINLAMRNSRSMFTDLSDSKWQEVETKN